MSVSNGNKLAHTMLTKNTINLYIVFIFSKYEMLYKNLDNRNKYTNLPYNCEKEALFVKNKEQQFWLSNAIFY